MRSLFRLIPAPVACTALTAFVCTFTPDTYTPLVMERVDGLGDTVSPFPSLRFAFSMAVENDNVSLYMEPEGESYYTQLNSTHDTLALVVTGMLQGSTLYSVSPAEKIVGATGSALQPRAVSFSFCTYPREQEPNDTRDTSMRFENPIYGEIFNTHDTDYFCVDDAAGSGLYLRSHDAGVALGLGIADTAGHDTTSRGIEPLKYVAVPDSMSRPLFARVFSVTGKGRYELGAYQP